MSSIKNLNLLWTYSIVETLVKANCNNFFISPGLRNTPIIKAIINNNQANHYIGIDERAMAYRALGCSKITGLPSVLVCTSGTALANYFPAVIEAFESNIPLIILSADRPQEMVWSHSNQSIKQTHIFGHYVSDSVNLECPNVEFNINSIINQINYKIEQTKTKSIPLHINMPFREPLTSLEYTFDKKKVRPTKVIFSNQSLIKLPKDLQQLIKKAKKPFLTFGSISNQSSKYIKRLTSLDIPKYLDITSNLKFLVPNNHQAIPSFDHPEVLKYFKENLPDLIIHFGDNITSKNYNNFIKDNSNIPIINIGSKFSNKNNFNDNSFFLNIGIKDWDNLFYKILKEKINKINFKNLILNKANIIEKNKLSTPWISKNIIEGLPLNSILYLGNSTIIRSFDLYSTSSNIMKHHVLYNRGVSGIEGFIASALGSAEQVFPKPIYLILGDISFIHDLNSLMMPCKDSNLKIIVLNNNSGGIFSLLPIRKDTEVLNIISTKHTLQFKKICQNFNLDYNIIKNKEDFNLIRNAHKLVQNQVFEIEINEENNAQIYKKLKSIK